MICLQLVWQRLFSPKLAVQLNLKWAIAAVNPVGDEEHTLRLSSAGTKAACHGSPPRQGIPASPRRAATVTQQLFFFSDRSLLVSWLVIHHLRGKRRAFMYTTPVAVFIGRALWPATTLPCLPSFAGGDVT